MKAIKYCAAALVFLSAASALAAEVAVSAGPVRKQLVLSELTKTNAALEPATRRQKYIDMAVSPLAFYRATAQLFYRDIDSGVIAIPASWPKTPHITTWINGDFHTQNIGFFHNRKNQVVFGLNDFDESFPAPFYFDLIRFITALYLNSGLTQGWHLKPSEADAIVADTFLAEYQSTLKSILHDPAKIPASLDASTLSGPLRDKLIELTEKGSNKKLLKKWTVMNGSARIFDLKNSDLTALTAEDEKELSAGWPSYVSRTQKSTGQPASYFAIKDRVARLNSGLGSRGLKKYYLLIEGATPDPDDDLILEVKESRQPAMLSSVLRAEAPTYAKWFATNHGLRNLTANQANISECDLHYGFLSGALRSYLVRPISPWKYSYEPADFHNQAEFVSFSQWSARALAYAHARSDRDYNASYVGHGVESGILSAIKAWPAAKTTLQTLGRSYAAQVQADFGFFTSLRAEGAL